MVMIVISLPSGGRGGGGQMPPYDFRFCLLFWLSAQRSVMAMIVPLPHYEIFWDNFRSRKKKGVGVPPPPAE